MTAGGPASPGTGLPQDPCHPQVLAGISLWEAWPLLERKDGFQRQQLGPVKTTFPVTGDVRSTMPSALSKISSNAAEYSILRLYRIIFT